MFFFYFEFLVLLWMISAEGKQSMSVNDFVIIVRIRFRIWFLYTRGITMRLEQIATAPRSKISVK
jgi:hypothetical protein